MGSRRPADYEERLRRLFDARRRGDTEYLIEALRRDRDVSTLPAKWLADEGVTAALPALLEMLSAADPHARWAAVAALQKLGPPDEARSRLAEMALRDDDRYVRGWASATLGCYDDEELTQLLLGVLADPDWHVSQGAAIALGRRGDVVALGPLKTRLRELGRSPLQWYLHRLPFKGAIAALEARASGERTVRHRASAARGVVKRVHKSLRGLLWWWVFLLALSVVLGWALGDWHSAWRVVQMMALIIAGLAFVSLIVAGFLDLRNRKDRE